VPFALTFTGNVDPTAVATFVLAALTLAAVIVGGKALRKTQSEIYISRREVEEAHRPVVIPIIDETRRVDMVGATQRMAKPWFAPSNRVVVPITNIGSGPALDIEVSVTPRNDAGGFSEAWGDRKHTGTVVGVGVSDVMPVAIYVPNLGDVPSFDLWVTYTDVAEKRWVTSAKYLVRTDGGKYTKLSITAG